MRKEGEYLNAEFSWRNPQKGILKFWLTCPLTGKQYEMIISDKGVRNWKLLFKRGSWAYFDLINNKIIVRPGMTITGPAWRKVLAESARIRKELFE